MFFAYDDINENTDTTDTPVPGECADCSPETPETIMGRATFTPAPVERKVNPIVYVGLGIALVAMGEDFLRQGMDELTRTGLRKPRVLR